jgi:hypothetical protein
MKCGCKKGVHLCREAHLIWDKMNKYYNNRELYRKYLMLFYKHFGIEGESK